MKLTTDPYKGTRDFYPEDMAIQRYIFDTWAETAESFGYERYDASILEPSELYKSKGAENEELVNEQTYTFTDRGEREVTLRPEMTPTVARMVAGRRRDLSLPIRWYSIPNLFRYERPQRGRLREHWQLNCDMFGVDDVSADVEMIALAYNVLKAFGAKDSDFEIRLNNKIDMKNLHDQIGITNPDDQTAITRINDRKNKITDLAYEQALGEVTSHVKKLRMSYVVDTPDSLSMQIKDELKKLGILNVQIDRTIARGFDYYTGTIFEIFDTSAENNRSLIGGGRYDNLTEMFGGEPVSGIGFGMGDVTMRDFLETHGLLEGKVTPTAPALVIIPENSELNIEGQKIAQEFRNAGIRVSVDISDRKTDKKKATAEKMGSRFILVLDTANQETFTLKELATRKETTGTVADLLVVLSY